MNKKNTKIKGFMFTIVNSLSLGVLGIVDKLGTGHYPGFIIFSTQSLIYSFLFVTIFALIYFKNNLFKNIKKITFSSWRLIFFIGILSSGLYILFRFLGLVQSTGTFATLAQAIITAETALFARVFLKEKLSRKFWMFFFIILIAIYFVSIGKFTLSSPGVGDWYIIFATVFIAVGNIFSKIVVNKVNPVLVSQIRFFFGALFVLLITIFIFHQTSSLLTFSIWAVLSGFLWAISVVTFTFAISYIGVTITTSILMIAPVYTMILEYVLLGYIFNPIQIAAACIAILSGTLLVVTKNK